MSNIDNLIETLIEATESKKASWGVASNEDRFKINLKCSTLLGMYFIKTEDKDKVFIAHYTINNNPNPLIQFDNEYTEKVSLIIFDSSTQKIITQIEEAELEESHRLWTLFKLADRSEKGADKVIDSLIKKFRPFNF